MKSSEIFKLVATLVVSAGVLTISTISVFGSIPPLRISLFQAGEVSDKKTDVLKEGPPQTPTITVGPFDMHRRYKSMEGPYAVANIRIGDLIAGKQVTLPEGTIQFTERSLATPSMKGGPGSRDSISTLPDTSGKPPGLFWLKGFKLDVLDETGKVLANGEFLCHVNVDVDPNKRNQLFPDGARCKNSRLLTLTQGQAKIMFPEGFAVPVCGDEVWRFMFQAANRTTDAHRRIKQRLTIYVVPEGDLVEPVTALGYFNPSVEVIVDKNKPEIAAKEKSLCALCLPAGRGVVPPNAISSSVSSDRFGRKTTVHWLVPPGESHWSSTMYDPEVGGIKPLLVHAVWSHIHPCCTSFSFVRVTDKERTPLWTVKSRTDTTNGLQIQDIDYIISKTGILVPGKSIYQTDITYNNTTGQPLDSMATMGAFFEDNEFVRPKWIYEKDLGQFCGVSPTQAAKSANATTASVDKTAAPVAATSGALPPPHPVFNVQKDGPLLSASKTIKIQTSAGNLTFTLEPSWAPETATQIARLFEQHAFDGTEICACEPNFLIQVALAENKSTGYPPVPEPLRKSIRRLPLEIDAQNSKEVYHRPGMLSMAREPSDPLGASSSFSILLGDEPHLDKKYTIFGQISTDQETQDTIKKIVEQWPTHPSIIKTLAM